MVEGGSCVTIRENDRDPTIAEARWDHLVIQDKVDIPQWTARWRSNLATFSEGTPAVVIDNGIAKGKICT